MKRFAILVFFAVAMVLCPTMLRAQDPDFYLQKARQRLAEGDCEKALLNYKTFHELTELNDYELKSEIDNCIGNQNDDKPQKLKIGELIEIEGKSYPIAYIDITGQHGWAIAEVDVSHAFEYSEKVDNVYVRPYLSEVKIINKEILPSKYDFVDEDEFEYIYENKSLISSAINGKYCSNTYKKQMNVSPSYNSTVVNMTYYFTFLDFRTGQKETLTKNASNSSSFRSRSFVRISF